MTVRSDLEELLQLELNPGEAPAAYAKRLAIAANNLSDDDWQSLGDGSATQIWVNDALEAVEKKKAIPLPEGLDKEEATAEEPEVTEAAPAKANGAVKAAKKAKAAPKPKVAAKKAAPAKKGKAKAAPVKGDRPGPKGRFARTDKIKLLTKENPFRAGSKCADWWDKLKDGTTVEAAIAAGVPRHHIRWELTLGNVKIG